MRYRITQSLTLLYDFIRNPFDKPLDSLEDDKGLVFLASILSGFVVIVRTLNQTELIYEPLLFILYILIGLLLTPLFGLLIVHFKGAVFHLYLKYVVSAVLKEKLDNITIAKQIETFATIGLIVSAVPSLTYIGIGIGVIIEIMGLHRLFKINLVKSIFIGVIYHAVWWGLILLVARGTSWI